MVSTLEPRKNHIRMIRAWEQLCARRNTKLKLILVGELGWQVEPILDAMRPWQVRGELLHLQKVPAEYLRLLYRYAKCVVCPSIKEGFDLSGAEAMACGGIVVASDINVHREIYGAAAVYFDPHCVKQQSEALEEVVFAERGKIKRLAKLSIQQASLYQKSSILPQWDEFFEKVVN